MPTQPLLIDPAKADKLRGQQLAAVRGLAARLQGVELLGKDGYGVSRADVAWLFSRFDDICSELYPENWQGLESWSEMTGLSVTQIGRVISVLESLGLIRTEHRMFGLKRREVVSIEWERVFDTATPLVMDSEHLFVRRSKKIRQRQLFGKANSRGVRKATSRGVKSVTHGTGIPELTPREVLLYVDSLRDSPTHSPSGGEGEVAEGSRDKGQVPRGHHEEDRACSKGTVEGPGKDHLRAGATGQGRECVERDSLGQDTDRRGEPPPFAGSCQILPDEGVESPELPSRVGPDVDFHEAGINDADRAVRGDHLAMVPRLHSPTNQEQRTKNGSGPSPLNPQPSTPPMLRTIQPGEPELIRHLTRLGSTGAATVIKSSLAIGYTPQHISEILEHWEALAIEVDGLNGQKKVVRPHTINQLCQRLQDPNAIPGDGIGPQHGRWGPIDGLYTLAMRKRQNAEQKALEAVLQAPEPKQAPPVGQKVEIPPYTKPEILALAQQHPPDRLVQASIDRWKEGDPCPRFVGLWAVRVGRETRD